HYKAKSIRSALLVQKLTDDPVARRAAELAKCDLTTELVKEFPELQGKIGGLYAKSQGEPDGVAEAIYDQYEPVPRTRAGQIVALADRLDTLQSFFIVGLAPTGSKDPFALRRAALGVVRVLIEGRHEYTLDQLLDGANANWSDAPQQRSVLREFLLDRVRYYFRDVRGYRYDEVHAVLAAGADNLADVADRLEALSQVR